MVGSHRLRFLASVSPAALGAWLAMLRWLRLQVIQANGELYRRAKGRAADAAHVQILTGHVADASEAECFAALAHLVAIRRDLEEKSLAPYQPFNRFSNDRFTIS